jgi:hypothetical protein
MKKIKLTQNKIALVDNEDYERLTKWSWYVVKKGHNYYAVRQFRLFGKKKIVYMHRQALEYNNFVFGKNLSVDHIDHNGLNNQKHNLRVVNSKQQAQNRKKTKKKTSKFKGVCWDKLNEQWRAYIKVNGKELYLGLFDNEKKAAKEYNYAAKQFFR